MLSESDEAATRYDRQVRLWGSSTQLKIQNAAITIVGTGGCIIETAKNVCLAGVGRITLLDSGVTSKRDLSCSHLFHQSDIGTGPRGAIIAARLRDMNPLVDVTFSSEERLENAPPSTVLLVSTDSLKVLTETVRAYRQSSGLIVSVTQVSTYTLGLLLPCASSANGVVGDLEQLLFGTDSLRGKPMSFQLPVLYLIAKDQLLATQGSTTTFAVALRCVLQLRAAQQADAVDDAAVLVLVDALVDSASSVKPTAIDATIGGGVCAQHIINSIGDRMELRWFALATAGGDTGSTVECIVGP